MRVLRFDFITGSITWALHRARFSAVKCDPRQDRFGSRRPGQRRAKRKTPKAARFRGFENRDIRSALAELRSTTCSLEAVLLKVSGSKILYLSRFLSVMPLGCPLGCPREAPVLVWCLFPLGFYNIAQADCFFKRQEEEPILFGSSTGYSAFTYMLLNALFTMVDSASGLLYFTLAYMSIVILLFS